MCLLCIEFQKQQMTMTLPEARRAFAEMRVAMDPQHVNEVEAMIQEAEAEEAKEAKTGGSAAGTGDQD